MKRLLAIGGAGLAVIAIVASCTIFDGLDAGAPDAGDAGTSDVALLPGEQPGYLSLADGVAFCSNVFACPNLQLTTEFSIDVPVDSNRFSSCVDWVSGPLPQDRNGHDVTAAVLQCAAEAKSCNEAGGCFWEEIIDPGDPRCAGRDAGPLGTCGDDAGSVYFCGPAPTILHCENNYFQPGTTCIYDDGGAPWCNTVPCGATACIGDRLTYCAIDGVQVNLNCAMGGFTCGYDSKENYDDCLTNGARKKCSALSISCTGTTAEICDGVFASDYDCATYGGSCDQANFPRCKRPNEACTPYDGDVDVCMGSSITLCVNGAKTNFDCSSIGKTCVAASGGQSGHCQ